MTIPILWKLREFCYSQILGLCREQSSRDGTPLFRSWGQQQLCPRGADLPYLIASWDVPLFFVVNFCWVLPASVVQGRLHNLEKLGQGRTSQRRPLSVFFRTRQHVPAQHCLHSWAGAARACEITDVRQYERARRKCVAYESCFILGENDWNKYSMNLYRRIWKPILSEPLRDLGHNY